MSNLNNNTDLKNHLALLAWRFLMIWYDVANYYTPSNQRCVIFFRNLKDWEAEKDIFDYSRKAVYIF